MYCVYGSADSAVDHANVIDEHHGLTAPVDDDEVERIAADQLADFR